MKHLLLSPRFWVAVFSLAAVMLFAMMSIERTSPGELTAVHGRDPHLAGGRSCSQCHGGWFSTMTDSCLSCHEPIAEQLESKRGLHGRLDAKRAGTCALCHSEHHGTDFAIVNRQSFALADVPDPEKFDHALVGFDMSGKHLELECEKCHEHARDTVLPEGAKRFIGLDQDCSTCHEDAHKGTMRLACADCHGQTDFKKLEPRDHDRFLPLTGGHADLACAKCHADGGDHSIDSLGQQRPHRNRLCADCHESPHDPDFVGRVAAAKGESKGSTCVVCHAPEHTSFRDQRLELAPALHALTGFTLDEPHEKVACADCHRPDAGEFRARYPGRKQDDCRTCHQDPHGGQFDGQVVGAAAERGPKTCLDCHDRTKFEPHAFTTARHAQTGFALTGAHLDIECSECHAKPSEEAPRQFRGTPSRCEDCHADAHVGAFDAELAKAGPTPGGTCALCHTTVTFADQADERFDHGRWASFPLHGAHEQELCESCHPRGPEPDRFGRTFGRVREHFGEYHGCVTCHKDPHQGRFDRPDLPASVENRTSCARCHGETSFRVLPQGFEHGRWTAFPLVGAHRDVACTGCHDPIRGEDALGRTWLPARGTRCESCHADRHAGQFRVGEGTDCSRCHAGTAATFHELRFDHETQSRFPLGEAHSPLPCAACHKPFDAAGRQVIRYRPLDHGCADCHGTIRDPLRRGDGRKR